MNTKDFVDIAPYFEDKLMLWETCVGDNGKIAPNSPEY